MSELDLAEKNTCFVCGRKNISDQHHILPVEYDGPENGKTVPLCPTDHRSVHREAEQRHKTNETGKYINEELYPNANQRRRANILAEYVYQAKIRFEASGKSKADDSRNIIQVSMKPDELAIAHDLKRQMKFKSLSRMVKHLIFERWQQNQKG